MQFPHTAGLRVKEQAPVYHFLTLFHLYDFFLQIFAIHYFHLYCVFFSFMKMESISLPFFCFFLFFLNCQRKIRINSLLSSLLFSETKPVILTAEKQKEYKRKIQNKRCLLIKNTFSILLNPDNSGRCQ